MRTTIATCALCLLVLPAFARGAEVTSLLRRVGEFGAEVGRIEVSTGRSPLEELLRRGNSLASELKPLIEQLSDQDFQSVERGMRGYFVNREEVILVEPDTQFFSKLARKAGTERDRLYFEYMVKVRPDGYWPAYVARQTDAGGCIQFGTGLLATLYKEGSALLPEFTGYYGNQIEKTLEDLAHQLTAGVCACGKISSVKKELETFVEMNPNAPFAGAVRERMKTLDRGALAVMENCVGG